MKLIDRIVDSRAWDWIAGGLAVGILWLLILGATQAQAHDWYPRSCCNERDCSPVPISMVEVRQDGYWLAWLNGGTLIPYAKANSSPDGGYHYCVRSNDTLRKISPGTARQYPEMNRSGVCFWAPEAGS